MGEAQGTITVWGAPVVLKNEVAATLGEISRRAKNAFAIHRKMPMWVAKVLFVSLLGSPPRLAPPSQQLGAGVLMSGHVAVRAPDRLQDVGNPAQLRSSRQVCRRGLMFHSTHGSSVLRLMPNIHLP